MSYAKPMIICLIALVAASVMFSGHAEAKRFLSGLGVSSCGTWTKIRPYHDDSGQAVVSFYARMTEATEQWVLGFLSGANVFTDYDILKETDWNAVMSWMDDYCKANPLAEVHEAATELRKALEAKAAKRAE